MNIEARGSKTREKAPQNKNKTQALMNFNSEPTSLVSTFDIHWCLSNQNSRKINSLSAITAEANYLTHSGFIFQYQVFSFLKVISDLKVKQPKA